MSPPIASRQPRPTYHRPGEAAARFRPLVGGLAGLALAACAGVPGFVRYPPVELAHIPNPHLYKGGPACQSCHVDGRAELLKGPIETCHACHQSRHSPGHESGKPPGQMRGVSLPLPGGVVVCHTCHDAHDLKKHPHGLRKPVNDLCRSCHLKT